MNLTDNIKTFLRLKANNEPVLAPKGFCPNCWGRQEYGGKLYEAMKNEGVNVTNIDLKKGWIQDYLSKNLSGIVLQKKGESQTCGVCYTSYNHEH